MMRTRKKTFRVVVAVVAAALLLFPGWLMAIAFTSLNFIVALGAVLASLFIAVWLPQCKWISAVVSSILIAVPPYPYWMHASEERGWSLDFFSGFSRSNLPALGAFFVVFVFALLLFAAIFWAIGNRVSRKGKTAGHAGP